jgi:hypothetical protein
VGASLRRMGPNSEWLPLFSVKTILKWLSVKLNFHSLLFVALTLFRKEEYLLDKEFSAKLNNTM